MAGTAKSGVSKVGSINEASGTIIESD